MKVRTENAFSWRKDDEQCSMCLSIALRISRIIKCKLADLAQFWLKFENFSSLRSNRVQNFREKYFHMLFVKMAIISAKNLFWASAKLEIWHTRRLGHAQKNPQNYFWSPIHSENVIWKIRIPWLGFLNPSLTGRQLGVPFGKRVAVQGVFSSHWLPISL